MVRIGTEQSYLIKGRSSSSRGGGEAKCIQESILLQTSQLISTVEDQGSNIGQTSLIIIMDQRSRFKIQRSTINLNIIKSRIKNHNP